MGAAINSNTPVSEYLAMPIPRFYEIWNAICAVYEDRAQMAQQQREENSPPRTPKPRRRRRR